MGTTPSVEIRLAGPSDIDEIARVLPELAGPNFSERFPGATAGDFCRWKYFANPAGAAAVGVALSGGRVVSLSAAVPKYIRFGSTPILTFELGDFITVPSFRGRGLFSHLIELLGEEARARGASFVYVRPNPMSFRILSSRLGFIEARRIDQRRYVVPSGVLHRKVGLSRSVGRRLGLDEAARRAFIPRAAESVIVRSVKRFDTGVDDLWARAGQTYAVALVRDSRYLNWRYSDSPTPYRLWVAERDGRTAGYAVGFTSNAEQTGYVVDLFADPGDDEAVASLIHGAFESMFADGVHAVYAWTLQSDGDSAAARLMARACRRVSTPHLHLAMKFLAGGPSAATLPSGRWQLAVGDFDGV